MTVSLSCLAASRFSLVVVSSLLRLSIVCCLSRAVFSISSSRLVVIYPPSTLVVSTNLGLVFGGCNWFVAESIHGPTMLMFGRCPVCIVGVGSGGACTGCCGIGVGCVKIALAVD